MVHEKNSVGSIQAPPMVKSTITKANMFSLYITTAMFLASYIGVYCVLDLHKESSSYILPPILKIPVVCHQGQLQTVLWIHHKHKLRLLATQTIMEVQVV